ncbi:MAG: sulfotransferase domain-containing protein [Myxococcota bacterium]
MPVDVSALRPYRTAVFDNRRWASFAPRPDDIFVCTPPKCGTTWTQTIIASLLWPDGDAPGSVMAISPWIEFELTPVDAVMAAIESQTQRRFMKSHTPADGIPWFPDAKYVVVARDGRDAFMSMCNHMERFLAGDMLNARAAADGVPPMPAWDGDVHGFFRYWLEQRMHLEHLASFWRLRSDPRVYLLHYNDLKADLAGEMRRLAGWLGISVPEAKWPAAVERCTFEAMRERGAEIGPFEIAFEGGAKGFIFKGTNGRWRDVLTPEEIAAYQKRVSELLPPDAAAWAERGRSALRP